MKVTLYAYNLVEKRIRGKENKDVELFEKDFVDCIKVLCAKDPIDKKYELDGTKKVIYLDNFEYDKSKHLLFLNFKSAEFGVARKVINTETLKEEPEKKKGQKDGDEETTCLLIKFDEDEKSKRATGLLQVNSRGVSLSRIFEYINMRVRAIHDANEDNIKYTVKYTNVISSDFLKALEQADKIKTVKLVIDAEASGASEFKDFASSEDVSDIFEIMYKPTNAGLGIMKDTVKKFFDNYKKDATAIKRIWIDSNEADGNPLTFDTEKMKEKIHITVSDTLNSEPDVNELQIEMIREIAAY